MLTTIYKTTNCLHPIFSYWPFRGWLHGAFSFSGISALLTGLKFQPCLYSVLQNSIKIKRAIAWQNSTQGRVQPEVEISTPLQLAGLKFQPQVERGPRLKILSCNRFNPFSTQGSNYSWVGRACAVVTIYYKKTKWRLWSQCRERIAFQLRRWNRPCNRKKFQPG